MVEKSQNPPKPIAKSPSPPSDLPKNGNDGRGPEFVRGKIEPTEKK